jgi:hypothetical protein
MLPTQNNVDLPSYLGLGILDVQSINYNKEITIANYIFDNEIIYQVKTTPIQCEFTEYLNGKFNGMSVGTDLKDCFIRHMLSIPPYANRRFEQLYNKITGDRNIYIKFQEKPEVIFYPAGYIFGLRIPIVQGNYMFYQKMKKNLENSDNPVHIKMEGEHPGILFRMTTEGKIEIEEITLFDCTAILTHLVKVVQYIWDSRVILPEKEYRLYIADFSEIATSGLPVFLGSPENGFLTFSVFRTDQVTFDLQELTKTFNQLSIRLLKSVSKNQ